MNNAEAIERLREFNKLINDYFDGNYNNKKELKSKINILLPIAQVLVKKAETLKLMTMAPPPAVGGMIIKNFNPFDMIFTDMWGRSVIPDVSNMVEQALGKYENNLVVREEVKKTIKTCNVKYPEKITIKWLFEHVPIEMTVIFIGMLVSAFLLGFNLPEILYNTTTIQIEKYNIQEDK